MQLLLAAAAAALELQKKFRRQMPPLQSVMSIKDAAQLLLYFLV